MSYLNANIPPIYCKVKKEYLYDLKKHQEKMKNVWSSVSHLYRDVQSYLTSCYQMVHAFGACLSQRFFKNHMIEPLCRICRRTSWNCGTVLVTTLVLLVLIGWLV